MLRVSHIDLNAAALSLVTQKLTKHYRSATAWSLPKLIKLRKTMDAIEGMDCGKTERLLLANI